MTYIRYAVLFLVAQSCTTLFASLDYSPPGSSVHGDSLGKNTRVGCHAIHQISRVKKDTRRRCRGGRDSLLNPNH